MIKSVKKAMDILTILSANAEQPMTLGELAERTGINKSTCAHIVDTLCDSLYVERISRTKGYRLGPWAYMLSRYGRYQNSLVSISRPVLKWLQVRTGATVFISVICNGKKYIVYHIDKDNILPMSDGSIIQGRLETTATGLLLMTHMDRESLRHALDDMTGGEGSARISKDLSDRMQKIRSQGYAYYAVPSPDQGDHQSYAFGISDGNKVVAALGILFPDELNTPDYRDSILKLGRTAANEISRRLEFAE